jgi:ornithine carbamoyltransferase
MQAGARRARDLANEPIDGPQSVVFDEAENRLHAQKTILKWCLG